jgi:serine/threonine protein kinase
MTAEKKPRTIGGWTILREIGGGGQGRVFEVVHGEGKPIHALKLITSKHPQKRARFAQEIRKHIELVKNGARNIVPIVDHNLDAFEKGQKEGFIVMPRAETTLEREANLLRERIELSLEIFEGIVRGVAEAHSNGVIHRDLKPPNILFLDKSLKTPLVSDFGICLVKGTSEERRLTMANETVGARYYMAPEQERGGIVDVTEAADTYALGKTLHFMLTGRNMYREELEKAFTEDELRADSRLLKIHERILVRTIILDAEDRIQTAQELLREVEALRGEIAGSSGGVMRGNGGSSPSLFSEAPTTGITLTPAVVDQLGLDTAYRHGISELTDGHVQRVSLAFDLYKNNFRATWASLRASIEQEPHMAPQAVENLIRTQTEIIGTSLAMARIDASVLFPSFRKYLEAVTRASERQSGYPAVNSVPHAFAGYLYMVTSVASLISMSWEILADLMRKKFEWYYQSDRPLFTLGFAHPYFFHADALKRSATEIHDLFRREMMQQDMLSTLGIEKEEVLDAYIQTQMLMSLRAAQETESGADVSIWADFGRFYPRRVYALLERMREDDEYASGVLKSFEEPREDWLLKLNPRLQLIRDRFWGGSFFWESIVPEK